MDKSKDKTNEYFTELKIKLQDFRDNRGKKHTLAYVILSFLCLFSKFESIKFLDDTQANL